MQIAVEVCNQLFEAKRAIIEVAVYGLVLGGVAAQFLVKTWPMNLIVNLYANDGNSQSFHSLWKDRLKLQFVASHVCPRGAIPRITSTGSRSHVA